MRTGLPLIYVLAGSYSEYREFVRQFSRATQPLTKGIDIGYVSDPYILHGVRRGFYYVKLAGFSHHDDRERIMHQIRVGEGRELQVSGIGKALLLLEAQRMRRRA